MDYEPIRIDGLRDLTRSLRQVDSNAAKQIRLALNVMADAVIAEALPKVPRRTGRAAKSIAARSTGKVARVKAGSNRAPYYPWLDFGGRVGPSKSVRRAFLKNGRYIYPAYGRLKESGRLADIGAQAMRTALSNAGLDVT